MIIIFILLLGLFLRLILINQSLWLDEAAQVFESLRPFKDQLDLTNIFHPPLYHLFMHFWLKLGTGEVWMRLPTVIISLWSIYLLYLIARKILDNKNALLVSLLLAINPYAVYYAQEIRSYPITVFLSLLIVWGVLNESLLLMILGLTLFLYSSYFAVFFIIGLLIYAFFYKKNILRKLVKSTLIAGILFSLWLPTMFRQLTAGVAWTKSLPGWSEAVSLPAVKSIPIIFAKFFLGRITIDNKYLYGSIIFLLIILFFFLVNKSIKIKKKKNNLSLVLFSTTFVLSIFTTVFIPVLDPKRIIFILPFFILILVTGLSNCSRMIKNSLLLIIISLSIFGLTNYYFNPRFQREHWKEAVRFVEKEAMPRDLVVFAFPEPFAPYLYYEKKIILTYGAAKNMIVNDNDLIKLEQILINRKRIYFFQYLTGLTDPDNKIKHKLTELGFSLTATYDFPGVGFIFQYDKTSLALAP